MLLKGCICLVDVVEDIVVKGETAGFKDVLHCPQCFQKLPFPGLLKAVIV